MTVTFEPIGVDGDGFDELFDDDTAFFVVRVLPDGIGLECWITEQRGSAFDGLRERAGRPGRFTCFGMIDLQRFDCWAVTRESIGHDPTADEVAEWWVMSRRTAFASRRRSAKHSQRSTTPPRCTTHPTSAKVLAKDAALGDRIDKWADERKARREEAVRAALGNATTN